MNWREEFLQLAERISSHGIAVRSETLGASISGTFDGVNIVTNSACDWETRCHVLAHCFGHTVQWSLEPARYSNLYRDLESAKANKATNPVALQQVLTRFRLYEEEASAFGVGLYRSNVEAVTAFVNFARADIEAILAYHEYGSVPEWDSYFAEWNAQVRRGTRTIAPLPPRRVPLFTPVPVPKQEVIQG